jgi:hypothetical protein
VLLEIVVGENWTCGEKASKKKSGQENSVSLSLCICLCVSVSFSLSCGGFLFCRLMEAVQKNEMIGEKVSRFSGFRGWTCMIGERFSEREYQ